MLRLGQVVRLTTSQHYFFGGGGWKGEFFQPKFNQCFLASFQASARRRRKKWTIFVFSLHFCFGNSIIFRFLNIRFFKRFPSFEKLSCFLFDFSAKKGNSPLKGEITITLQQAKDGVPEVHNSEVKWVQSREPSSPPDGTETSSCLALQLYFRKTKTTPSFCYGVCDPKNSEFV